MTTITEVVPTLTDYAGRTTDPILFPSKADESVTFMFETLPASLNILSGQVNTVAEEVSDSVATATAQAAIATEQAVIATDYANQVVAAGTTQVGLVEAEGTAQIGLVEAEGTTQVGLVQSAGSVQITAVEAAGGVQIGLAADQVSLATTQAELASAAADQAILTADAVEWASADTYNKGRVVYDPFDNYKAYISQDDNNHGHVPSTDDGTWWTPILPPPATQAEMEAGTEETNRFMSPVRIKQAIIALAPPDKIHRSARTNNSALTSADRGRIIDIISGTFVQTFDTCSSLGDGWWCYVRNLGTGNITVEPAGVETIDSLSNFIMYPGEIRLMQCDGTSLSSIVLSGFYLSITVTDNFIVPPGYSTFGSLLWGGGGGGGGGAGGSSGSARYGGGGGGGGGFNDIQVRLTPGQTITMTIGAKGIGGTASNNGTTGGTSSFGAYGSAYGGQFGTAGSASPVGGYGGGILMAMYGLYPVITGDINNVTYQNLSVLNRQSSGFWGSLDNRYTSGVSQYTYAAASEYGGSGGGIGSRSQVGMEAAHGGRSVFGPTGGGGGGGVKTDNSLSSAGDGGGLLGASDISIISALVGGGVAASSSNGSNGQPLTSKYAPGGGAPGGAGNIVGLGYAGGNGASPGGGGGGGGGGTPTGGNGGDGGDGKIIIKGNI